MDVFDELGAVASCALRADDEIVGTITPNGEETDRGLQVLRGSHVLELAATAPGRIRVSYPFSVSGQLAQRLAPESLDDYLTPEEQSQLGPDEARQYAARKQVATIPPERQEELTEAALSEIGPVASRTTTATVTLDGQQCWDGLTVYDFLYPADDGFETATYDETVTQVLTEGHGCGSALLEAAELFEDAELDG